jgi:hypothetical protein
MKRTVYYLGGFNPAAPAQNRAEEWDSAAGTYTRWDQAGTVVETRPLSAAEVADFTSQQAQATTDANTATVKQRAQAALTANATFLALASPTNAQTLAQVQRLTKECSALIRLALSQLDTITDTA